MFSEKESNWGGKVVLKEDGSRRMRKEWIMKEVGL